METLTKGTINSVRLKVNNTCQWACTFCHNEGTELPEGGNAALRVSTFLDSGVKDLPPVEDVTFNNTFLQGLDTLRTLGINEIHLTGGEPTLHPKLPEIVTEAVDRGMTVKMTSNGQTAPAHLKRIVAAGVLSINFSILSLDPEGFLKTQNPPKIPGLDPLTWAQRMIDREKKNILLAKELGAEVKINTAVLGYDDYPRVDTVREFAEHNDIGLVVLPSIGDNGAQQVVFDYAEKHGVLVGEKMSAHDSNAAKIYQTTSGTELRAKYLKPYHPSAICDGCEHKGQDSCVEKFYGLRLEIRGGDPYVRLCVQKTNDRTVMPLPTFIERDLINQL
jgi:GTP 3',8-cyclase